MSEANNNRGEVEQQLQDAFSDFAVTADDAVWDSIEAAIQPEKKRRGAIWWFSSGVAAGVAVLAISYAVFQSSEDQGGLDSPAVTNAEQEAPAPTKEKTNAASTESILQEQDAALAAEDQAIETQETPETPEVELLPVQEAVATAEEGNTNINEANSDVVAAAEIGVGQEKHPLNTVVEDETYAAAVTDNQPEQRAIETPVMAFNTDITTNDKTTSDIIGFEFLNVLDRRRLYPKSNGIVDSVDWDMEPYAVSSGKQGKDDWSDWEDGQDPNADHGWGLLANLESAGSASGQVSDGNATELANDQGQVTDYVPTGGGTTSGVAEADQYSASPNAEVDYRSPLSIGLRAGFSFSRRWSLESGLSYSRLSTVQTTSLVVEDEKLFVNQHFIGAPLLLNYKFIDRKRFGMYSAAGMQIEKGISTVVEQRVIAGGEVREKNKLDAVAPGVQGAFVFGLGADYKINRFLSLYAQPSVSSWLLNYNVGSNVRNRQLLWPSVQMGVRFDL